MFDQIKKVIAYKANPKIWNPANWNDSNILSEEIHYFDNTKKSDYTFPNLQITNNLDGVKRIYFVLRTHFNRQIFKNLYPNIIITHNPETADVIAYPDTTRKNTVLIDAVNKKFNKFALMIGTEYYVINNEFAVNRKIMSWTKRKRAVMPQGISWLDPENRFNFCSIQRVFSIQDQIVDLIKCLDQYNKPFISTNDIFKQAQIELRKEDLSLEDMKDLTLQIFSKDISIKHMAMDIIAQLNIEKYEAFQLFMYLIYQRSTNESPRAKILFNVLKSSKIYQDLNMCNLYFLKHLETLFLNLICTKEEYVEYNIWFKEFLQTIFQQHKGDKYATVW